jgi:hypothetical protein
VDGIGHQALIAELIDSGASNAYFQFGKDTGTADKLTYTELEDSVTTSATNETTKPSTGAWHMYAAVFNSSLGTGAGKLTCYLDGVALGASTYTGTPSGNLTFSDTLSLLARGTPFGTAGSSAFDGAVSNVSVHTTAVSSSTIASLYSAMLPVVTVSGSDSAAATETSSVSTTAMSVSASDTAAGTDVSADTVQVRPYATAYAPTGSESVGLTGGSKPHRGFPGICTLADGRTLLRVYRRATSHTSLDGDLCCETSSDNGATWGTETVLRTTSQGFPDGSGSASIQEGNPLVLANGKVLITGWCNNGTKYQAFSLLSTDSTATAWGSAVKINHNFLGGEDYVNCTSPAIQLANGDLVVALAGLEFAASASSNAPYLYRVRFSKSTDNGATWTAYGSTLPGGPSTSSANGPTYDEPWMCRRADGSILMSVRQAASLHAYGSFAPDTNVHIWRSANDGATWTELGRAFDDMGTTTAMGQKNVISPARASIVEDSYGLLFLTHRIYIYNTTSPYSSGNIGTANGAYRVSRSGYPNDWSSPLDLHSGSAANTTSAARENGDGSLSATSVAYDYGASCLLNGEMAVVWGEENPSGTAANLFFRRFSPTLAGTTPGQARDSATLTEGTATISIVSTVSASETAAATDASAIVAQLATSDTAAATDTTLTLSATLATTDTGSATDTASVTSVAKAAMDSATATETTSVTETDVGPGRLTITASHRPLAAITTTVSD